MMEPTFLSPYWGDQRKGCREAPLDPVYQYHLHKDKSKVSSTAFDGVKIKTRDCNWTYYFRLPWKIVIYLGV